ncbi:MAG TPA: family 43 glycosylhydrolase [Chthoniobacterales bacterium]|nr:family 43 glycosylhydrolase [Chthoniobacterales bacterium]
MRWKIILLAACAHLSWGIGAGAFPLVGVYQGQPIRNVPDPAIIAVPRSPARTDYYMYGTNASLNETDRGPRGEFIVHLLPIFHSTDLIHWNLVGDVFRERPRWMDRAKLIAPDIQFHRGKYFVYYTAVSEDENFRTLNGGAIGVATSDSPTGPWRDNGKPVVEMQKGRWVYDPFVIADDAAGAGGQRYLFYGSYVGGLFARKLSADGLRTDAASEVRIALPDRYEGAYIRKRDGFFYLFVSSANCCNVGLTGYSVLVGRSRNLLGPYVDRTGASFLDSRAGGTPVATQNGNRWIGPGHNSIVTDHAGQDWFLYAAVDRAEPNFQGTGLTKRPPMLDPLDWVDGWPVLRGGAGPSEKMSSRPAAQPGQRSEHSLVLAASDRPGDPLPAFSREFNRGESLGTWAQNRVPARATFGLTPNGRFFFETQPRDLYADRNTASVLANPAPPGDYVVETKLNFAVPADFSNYDDVQAGLVIYGDDDRYIKLVHLALNSTRQIEFSKEIPAWPRFGSILLSPPADTTWLRIVKRAGPSRGQERYTAYTTTQSDPAGAPINWIRGGTWTHSLGPRARIGLIAMSGTGFTAEFDYLRVSKAEPLSAPSVE